MRSIHKGEIVGDYRVIEAAGSGGMGAVYKIEHLITRRIEAMKLLPPGSSSDPELVQRFEREIQVQARLHHPNIVELYTAVRNGSSIALVMEFVEGESLQRMLEAGPLPLETAVDFASQVLCALTCAHAAGVIHRDVGPANIIITPGLVAKLTDFGLARGAADLRLSTSGVPLGSPWYMSPEQVRGMDPLDARTDLYALGAVLYEMLTGEKLFTAEGAFAVMRAQVEAEPALPSSRNPGVPPELDRIVRKALSKDPALRFQSADEFRTALQCVNISAEPPTPPIHPRKGRSAKSAILLALVPALLLATLGASRLQHLTVGKNARPPAIHPVPDTATMSPSVAAPLPPQEPTPVPAIPVELPAAAVKSPPLSRAQSHRQSSRTSAPPPEHSYEIRVTGSEFPSSTHQPPAPVSQPAAVAEPPASSSEAETAATPPSTDAAVEITAGAPDAAPQDASAPTQTRPGNRFVRALGKINPFRKTAKPDAGDSKLPVKKP